MYDFDRPRGSRMLTVNRGTTYIMAAATVTETVTEPPPIEDETTDTMTEIERKTGKEIGIGGIEAIGTE